MKKMKLFLTGAMMMALAAVLLCAAGSAQAIQVNLVQNGGFDTDLSGWGQFGSVSWPPIGNPGGSVQLSLLDTMPSAAILSQNVSTEQGKTYTISFDLKGVVGSGTVRVDIGFAGRDFSFSSDSDWQSCAFDYTAQADSTTFYYVRFQPTGSASSVLLDNVVVREKTTGGNPVPIPGAVWLFAPAVTGLVGLRRRFNP